MTEGTTRQTAAQRLRDDLRFFRSWLSQPKVVGSVIPTSWRMATRMATVIDAKSTLPVLELGPGTGVTTRAMLARGIDPARIVSVEYDRDFCERLRTDYPAVNFIQGDAFDLQTTLGDRAGATFDCVISSLPLLHFPLEKRIALMEDVLSRIPVGRPVLQFSYGPKPSVPRGMGNYTVERYGIVFRNIPPAQLWVYRRPS